MSDMQHVLKLIEDGGIRYVDLRLVDVPGTWHHITIPARLVDAESLATGFAFDGSSVKGFRTIEESDMVMRPDLTTATVDAFTAHPTLALTCDVYTPDGQRYDRDPRYVAQKAEQFLRQSGVGDCSLWGPELEFFVFDEVRFENNGHGSFYSVDSQEGDWNSGKIGSLGYSIRNKEGYFPVAPVDTMADMRSEMVSELEDAGFAIERHHHEVATAGQGEINFRADTLTKTADLVLLYKYVLRNVAGRHGKSCTFMPKPLYGDNGSGMHVHQSIFGQGKNLFYATGGYGNLSEVALHYIGGILTHAQALVALTNPTTNSFKRLVPGYEAPVNLVFARGNRSAAVRVPVAATTEKSTRIEFRTPDGTCNPYLAFAAMLMAGLDGILNKIDPTAAGFGPLDRNIYTLTAAEKEGIGTVPASLEQALDCLRADHDFLLRGGVFSADLLQTWIEIKSEEAAAVRLRPHPMEFALFYDA